MIKSPWKLIVLLLAALAAECVFGLSEVPVSSTDWVSTTPRG